MSNTEHSRTAVLRFRSIPVGELPPPAPRDCFGRDELIEKLVELAENLEPVALIGAGGIGKTSIALTVLHHDRIEQRFGANRRFIRCDQFPASRTHFLARLSRVIGAGVENPEDLTPLRPLLSSQEMLIILDNAESILDPKEPNAKGIYSIVDELCQFRKLSLCITSRLTMVPPRCKRPEIPTLTMEAACDIFYSICGNAGRSSVINDLLKRLDFHALSIKLLATTAFHHRWDHDRLARKWDTQRALVLQTEYNESLAATIELSLASPTFHSLDPNARDLIGVAAFFPQGINEENLDWLFPTIADRENIFDKFCVLSLAHRTNDFITMLAPIRQYLRPKDPLSSPFLCATRDHYFHRLSVSLHPENPGFKEARWIVLEDVNVEYLLDVFTSTDQTEDDIWKICFHFVEHLVWHKPRPTILKSKIEALPDDHPFKPDCLLRLSWLFQQLGNDLERKRLLTNTLDLERKRGNDVPVAQILRHLSDANRMLGHYEEGIRQVKESSEICGRLNDTGGQALALSNLALLLFDDNQLDDAEDAASRGIDLNPDKDHEYIACQLHRVLGRIYQAKGRSEKAIHHFQTALRIASPLNANDELFWNHCALAHLFRGEGKFDEENTHIQQAKSFVAHDQYNLGYGTQLQADIWYRQGRLEEAKLEATHALEVFEKLGAAKEAESCRNLFQAIKRATENRSTRS